MYAIGQPFTGTRYLVSAGFCTSVSAPSRLYTIGPEVAPDSFVAGVDEVEDAALAGQAAQAARADHVD